MPSKVPAARDNVAVVPDVWFTGSENVLNGFVMAVEFRLDEAKSICLDGLKLEKGFNNVCARAV